MKCFAMRDTRGELYKIVKRFESDQVILYATVGRQEFHGTCQELASSVCVFHIFFFLFSQASLIILFQSFNNLATSCNIFIPSENSVLMQLGVFPIMFRIMKENFTIRSSCSTQISVTILYILRLFFLSITNHRFFSIEVSTLQTYLDCHLAEVDNFKYDSYSYKLHSL